MPKNTLLLRLITDEGYCCMYGYLKLCRERGETPKGMADNMGVAHSTIKFHYTRLVKGKVDHRCFNKPDCQMPDVLAIRALKG